MQLTMLKGKIHRAVVKQAELNYVGSITIDPKLMEAAGILEYEHGTIRISAVSYEMFARIDISDTGSGIPETEQAKIFARFYRSKAVQEQEGVGIGLYLARQIISGEGGYIKIASVPGKGSTFSIFLPK